MDIGTGRYRDYSFGAIRIKVASGRFGLKVPGFVVAIDRIQDNIDRSVAVIVPAVFLRQQDRVLGNLPEAVFTSTQVFSRPEICPNRQENYSDSKF